MSMKGNLAMANYNRNAKPFSKPFPVDLHYSAAELDALEIRARDLSRMDWTDKVKLIQGNRKGIEFYRLLIRCRSELQSVLADINAEQVPYDGDDFHELLRDLNEAIQ